ncbi:MAG: alpha/beta hydrolase-fold protein [Acidobacteriota bacterium]|nr:alpha/beta hydrolase-fold protein [Acidobacteriota bacterium]
MKSHACAVVLALLCATAASPQQDAPPLRYGLRSGDHLIYREVFEREGQSSQQTFRARSRFRNSLVVVDDVGGTVLVGVQRNRESTELLEYREHGKDKLAQESGKFAERMAKRRTSFAEASIYSATGVSQMPGAIVREAYSKLLYGISEIEPLPAGAVQAGVEMAGPFGLTMRLTRLVPISGDQCAEFMDTGTRKNTHLSYTFCPRSGTLARLEFSGEYREFGDSIVRERVALELVESRRRETPSAWLADPQVEQAALNAYLIAGAATPDAASLAALLRDGSPDVQALALAVYYQRKLALPQDALGVLAGSKDVEVQRIASRFSAKPADEVKAPCALPVQTYGRQKPGTTLHSMMVPGFESTPYMIHVPIDYGGDQPFPLLIYLSGGAGQALDGALSAEETVAHSGYIAIYPQAGGDMWWEQRPTAMVYQLLLEVLRSYNVDTNRVYLAGFSNGGTGALYYATLWPERFAAVASLMGAGMHSPSGETLPLKSVLNVPFLFLHGDKDALIPPSASVNTYDELRDMHPRITPELQILKDRGHEITLASDDGFTMPFLQRFQREPFPRNVAMKITTLSYPRRYWLEVLEKDNGPAEVEGRILADNVVELKTKNVRKLRLLLQPELVSGSGPVRVRVNGREVATHELRNNCELFAQSVKTYADLFLGYTDEFEISLAK